MRESIIVTAGNPITLKRIETGWSANRLAQETLNQLSKPADLGYIKQELRKLEAGEKCARPIRIAARRALDLPINVASPQALKKLSPPNETVFTIQVITVTNFASAEAASNFTEAVEKLIDADDSKPRVQAQIMIPLDSKPLTDR